MSNSTPYTSVIVPVFNDSRVKIALESLIQQTYPRNRYEIIVADNGSTNSVPELVEYYCTKYPNLVQIVYEKEVQSSYAARNKALEFAKGSYIAFTDSDCIPADDWIEKGVNALLDNHVSCGGGKIDFFFKSDRPNVYEYLDATRKLGQESYIQTAGFAATANFFIRNTLFEQYGKFRHDLISGGDYEFGRRLTQTGEAMIFIPDAAVKHPARSTLRQILHKTKRVANGQKELSSLGLLSHGTLSWKNWVPKLQYPRDNHWSKTHSFHEKLKLMILVSFFQYVNLWERIR